MRRKYVYLLLLLSLISCRAAEGNGHRQKYLESCSRSRKCDFTKWLRCENGKCVCYQSSKAAKPELYYDLVSERCVGRSGANCSQKFFPFDDEDPHTYHMRGPTTNHWRYGNGSLRCGASSFCDFDGQNHICTCRKNYYETEDGKCLKLKSHSDPCTNNKECDPDGFLHCLEGSCTCEKEHAIYDSMLNKCVVKTGRACEIRVNRLDKREFDDCLAEAHCDEDVKVCRCLMGTEIHSDGSCQKGFGQPCDHDHPCGDTKLSCRSKVCQCKYPLHMKYDDALGQCVGMVFGPCTYNDTSEMAIHCTRNAECIQHGLFSECRCKAGFLQTEDGDCVKVHGSDCEEDSDCDRVAPLACINDRCECPDQLLQYDASTRRCRGLVGARCKLHEDFCISNASCHRSEDNGGVNIGVCRCNRGFREIPNRTCTK